MNNNNELNRKIGVALKAERMACHLTLFSAAVESDIGIGTIRNAENGKGLKLDTLFALCVAYEVDVCDVIERAKAIK